MSRLSTKNYKPRATGSLRHLMLKVFCAVLLTAPYRLNYFNLNENNYSKGSDELAFHCQTFPKFENKVFPQVQYYLISEKMIEFPKAKP